MNYGFYISAAGALTNAYRQDVIANNLANSQTIGFKPHLASIQQRLPARLEGAEGGDLMEHLMERLGGTPQAAPVHVDMRQGELVPTGRDFDLAIKGDGFFVLNSGRGRGAERLRFSRDGRFSINGRGELVMTASGMQVLDERDEVIKLKPGARVRVDPSGQVFQDERPLAKIQIVEIPRQSQLRKAGQNLLMFTNTAQVNRRPAEATLEQGFLEASAVDPVMTLNAMINASKAAQAGARMLQYHDHLMDQAINRLGRVV